ncbi:MULTISPECIES: AbrB/MazE/SpoVT family DNA-binding domain-containing protein [Cupriavidus]
MLIEKWGNSLAVRLPPSVVKALALQAGDDIDIVIHASRTVAIRKTPDADALLSRLHRLRGKLPADFKFCRDQANAR